MLKTIFYVAFGGAIGSVLRFLTGLFLSKYCNTVFPIATFCINIVGCFVIGLSIGYLQKNQLMDSDVKWFLVSGLCGGFTTFSAFGQENYQLLQSNQSLTAITYITGSVTFGLLATALGHFLIKM